MSWSNIVSFLLTDIVLIVWLNWVSNRVRRLERRLSSQRHGEDKDG